MIYSAVDECIRNKRYSEAASLVVKNYKLSPQLTSCIAIKLEEHHRRKLGYLRGTGRSFLDIAQEAHLQAIDDLLSEGLIPKTSKSLSQQLSDDGA